MITEQLSKRREHRSHMEDFSVQVSSHLEEAKEDTFRQAAGSSQTFKSNKAHGHTHRTEEGYSC